MFSSKMSPRQIHLFTALVFIAGTSGITAQNPGQCENDLENSITVNNGPSCDVVQQYFKCLIRQHVASSRTLNIPMSHLQNVSASQLSAQLQNVSEIYLSPYGLSCDWNIQELIDEILEEWTTQSPVSSAKSTSGVIGQNDSMCGLDVQNTIVENNGLTCDFFKEYFKCVIRQHVVTSGNLNIPVYPLQNAVELHLSVYGLSCDWTIQEIIAEFLEEWTTQSPVSTTKSTSGDTTQNPGQCQNDLENGINNGVTCDVIQQFFKCSIRQAVASSISKNIPMSYVQNVLETQFQNVSELYLSAFGLSCDWNIPELIHEILKEWTTQSLVSTTEGTSGYTAQNPGQCENDLENSIRENNGITCYVTQLYFKCVIRQQVASSRSQNIPVSYLQNVLETQFQNVSELFLSTYGLSCEWTLQEIIDEIFAEWTTQSPVSITKSFEDAKNDSECLDAMFDQLARRQKPNCDVAQGYLECVMRVTGLHKQTYTHQEIQASESVLESSLGALGLDCDLDAEKALQELQNGGNASREPEIVVNGTNGVAGQDASQCINNLQYYININAGLTCDVFKQYLKCVIRPIATQIGFSVSMSDIQDTLDSQLSMYGLSCSWNIQDMIDEVIQERTPQSFDDAKNHSECLDAMFDQLARSQKPDCDVAQIYLGCVMRVTGTHDQAFTRQQIQESEGEIETSLREFGLDCDLDAQKAVQELQNSGNASREPENGDDGNSRNHSPGLTLQLTNLFLSLLGIKIVYIFIHF